MADDMPDMEHSNGSRKWRTIPASKDSNYRKVSNLRAPIPDSNRHLKSPLQIHQTSVQKFENTNPKHEAKDVVPGPGQVNVKKTSSKIMTIEVKEETRILQRQTGLNLPIQLASRSLKVNGERVVRNSNSEIPVSRVAEDLNPTLGRLVSGTSTTYSPGGTEGPADGHSVVGLVLALLSAIFIIIGLAFVFSHIRKKRRKKDQANGSLEMSEVSVSDPYNEWLNMPEEKRPSPTLKKQVKQVVRTVSRKISLKQHPPPDRFIPGVPDHLRYQLKYIYVY